MINYFFRTGFIEIYRKGGVKGLYDGWGPNAYRAAILTGFVLLLSVVLVMIIIVVMVPNISFQ